ncbi:hypothetical protein EUBDOL_00159 [Amedibacillus dolichus DSM 3991]|uniref:Uncharacterized protein n=1 Tax=Amedibacillus dolichus DSM 3991 TaxID=428127 RepID=A8R826_9FIRM|nr:hypothetical protein EUBDOL_00159 [Amedibacillus dolichus DSM 3991]
MYRKTALYSLLGRWSGFFVYHFKQVILVIAYNSNLFK